jgi:hypothetical protein
VDAEEDLLRRLLGLGPVAQHPVGDGEDAVLVGRHEVLEGARVARLQPLEHVGRGHLCHS